MLNRKDPSSWNLSTAELKPQINDQMKLQYEAGSRTFFGAMDLVGGIFDWMDLKVSLSYVQTGSDT